MVKQGEILIFKLIFLCQKSAESYDFFSLKNAKKGGQMYYSFISKIHPPATLTDAGPDGCRNSDCTLFSLHI